MDGKKNTHGVYNHFPPVNAKGMPFQKASLAVGINSKCGRMSSLGKRSYWSAVEECVPAPTSKTCACARSGAGGQCGRRHLFVHTVSSTELRARSSHIMLPTSDSLLTCVIGSPFLTTRQSRCSEGMESDSLLTCTIESDTISWFHAAKAPFCCISPISKPLSVPGCGVTVKPKSSP